LGWGKRAVTPWGWVCVLHWNELQGGWFVSVGSGIVCMGVCVCEGGGVATACA
jgi:hypothetical protein